MKKLNITILLTLLLSLFAANANAHDIEATNGDGVTIYYKWINDKTGVAVSCRGNGSMSYDNEYEGDIAIPSSIIFEGTSFPVTRIETSAFQYCQNVTSVILPSTITTISYNAFEGCSKMTSINLPNSITAIYSDAFLNCSSLKSIKLPNSITSIPKEAFQGCGALESITIPETVGSIGENAFRGCGSLNSIVVEEGNPTYDSRDNCNAIIETANNTIIRGSNSTIIPKSVTTIGEAAFSGCKTMTDLTIPYSVTTIGESAFSGCKGITVLTIPSNVKTIGFKAFEGCTGLTKVITPSLNVWCDIVFDTSYSNDGTNPLDYAHFLYTDNDTKITDLTLPEGKKVVPYMAFRSIYLNSLTIPASCESISSYAFYKSNIGEVIIQGTLNTILSYAFAYSVIGTINLSMGSYKYGALGHGAFKSASITNMTIPSNSDYVITYNIKTYYPPFLEAVIENLTLGRDFEYSSGWSSGYRTPFHRSTISELHMIGKQIDFSTTFDSDTKITSLYYPEDIEEIDKTIPYSYGIQNVNIPKKVTSIADKHFSNCNSLTAIKVDAKTPPTIFSNTFTNNHKSSATLAVPYKRTSLYQSADYWKEFAQFKEGDPQCETPTIKYADGKLRFECETEGVEFVSHATMPSSADYNGDEVNLPTSYTIEVYAKKEGLLDSDVATADIDIRGLKGDVNQDGVVSITDAVSVVNIILNGGE